LSHDHQIAESNTIKLKKALLSLLAEKDIHHITTKKIAEQANVSRGTLYLHFEDKFALFEEIVEEMLEGINDSVQESLRNKQYINFKEMDLEVHPTLAFVAENALFFKILMDREKMPFFDFHHFFIEVFKENIVLTPANSTLTSIERDLFAHYRALSIYAVIWYWMKEEMKTTPESITKQFWELIRQKRFYWIFGNEVMSSEKKAEHIDRRVLRTRDALQRSMIELILEKKEYSAVTISDITRKSNVRRATFYDHYSDKEELFKAIIRNYSKELMNHFTVKIDPKTMQLEEAVSVLIRLFTTLSEENSIIHFLKGDYGIPNPIPEIFHCLSEFYLEQTIHITAGKEMYAYYVTGMIVGLILYRANEGIHHSPEFLAREFIQFLDLKKYKVILI
jgi:AcrR family transcriptional regulator